MAFARAERGERTLGETVEADTAEGGQRSRGVCIGVGVPPGLERAGSSAADDLLRSEAPPELGSQPGGGQTDLGSERSDIDPTEFVAEEVE